jgi:hypothetical protein
VNHGLPSAVLDGRALLVHDLVKARQVVLGAAGAIEEVKPSGIDLPARFEVALNRAPESAAGLAGPAGGLASALAMETDR